jgi:hypothetical protein
MALPLRSANVNPIVALMISINASSACALNVFGKGYISLIVFRGSKRLATRYRNQIAKRYKNQEVFLLLSVTMLHIL